MRSAARLIIVPADIAYAGTITSMYANLLRRYATMLSAAFVVGTAVAKTVQLTLRRLSDEVFLLPGVDRARMKSLWTPTTRWVGVTEEGLEGGPVIPDGFDGSPAKLQQLAANVARSGEIGQTVARDATSTVIFVPLLAKDAQGQSLDYALLSRQLETLRGN